MKADAGRLASSPKRSVHPNGVIIIAQRHCGKWKILSQTRLEERAKTEQFVRKLLERANRVAWDVDLRPQAFR